jgi:hypothetical protein
MCFNMAVWSYTIATGSLGHTRRETVLVEVHIQSLLISESNIRS